MIKKVVFGIALLSAVQFTHAATDWTPQLTGLQDSCSNIFHLMEELPKKYQASIIRKSDVKLKDGEDGNDITTTYYLKDATAFGLPLDKIKEETNDRDFHHIKFSIVFKDTDFMKLRPSFYYTSQSEMGATYIINADMPKSAKYLDEDMGINVEYKNTSLGYEIKDYSDSHIFDYDYTLLHFDKETKSILCSQ